MRAAKGGVQLVETTAAGWGDGKPAAPQADWAQRRYGADPPAVLGALRDATYAQVLHACAVPAGLCEAKADGTAQREAWRRFTMGAVVPVLRGVQTELARKLGVPDLRLDVSSLYGHDLQGRAASFQKLVAGGMSVADAVGHAGLLATTE